MENRRILLIGGGGHCKSVIDSLRLNTGYAVIGIVGKESGTDSIMGVSQVGTDDDLPELFKAGWTDAFITVGSIGNTVLRRRLYEVIKAFGFSVPSIVDKTAIVASDVSLTEGIFIGKRAVVNAGTKLGACSIINTGAIIEHDCNVGSFAHISPGAILCGQVIVGNDAHIGAGATVRQQLEVGVEAIIGIGSVVTKNIPDKAVACGNPCKVVKQF